MIKKNQIILYQLVDWLFRLGMRQLPPTELLESIALWWGYRFKPQPRVSRLRSGSLIRTSQTDYLQLLIYYLGTFEPHCLPYLRACLSQGGNVLDVGANIGFYTVESATTVGPTGKVISVEAAPAHAAALRQNIELNQFHNVTIVQTAVGARPGEAILRKTDAANLGMYSLGAIEGTDAQIVQVRTIDDVLQDLGVRALDLIKMDIEGSEYGALLGGERSLKEYRPALLIEINDVALRSCGSSSQEVLKLLQDWNYRGWEIKRNSVEGINQDQFDTACAECIFLHRDQRSLQRRLNLV